MFSTCSFYITLDTDGFKGDVYLTLKLLLPSVVKVVYNLNSKQLIKIFAQVWFVETHDNLATVNCSLFSKYTTGPCTLISRDQMFLLLWRRYFTLILKPCWKIWIKAMRQKLWKRSLRTAPVWNRPKRALWAFKRCDNYRHGCTLRA